LDYLSNSNADVEMTYTAPVDGLALKVLCVHQILQNLLLYVQFLPISIRDLGAKRGCKDIYTRVGGCDLARVENRDGWKSKI
jgi:hypothetical protein